MEMLRWKSHMKLTRVPTGLRIPVRRLKEPHRRVPHEGHKREGLSACFPQSQHLSPSLPRKPLRLRRHALMASTEHSTAATSEMDEEKEAPPPQDLTLGWVRDALIRQEDSIVFALIERARFPYNAPAYDPSLLPQQGGRSLVEAFARGAEVLQAKFGRYQNPEEVSFFPDDLPAPSGIPYNFPEVFHPASASVTANNAIWNMYFNDLLPLFTVEGDDGNYTSTAAADLVCLQALSRRIHYGKYVAEVKFRDAPQDYMTAICAKDRDALMKLLTFEAVEEMVKRRVLKKAMVFGQTVTLEDKTFDDETKYKVDPAVVARLYDEWVIPLTKDIEVEYLLRRLD